MHQPILGRRRSGKSRGAEARAATWLRRPGRSAWLHATALPGDGAKRRRLAHRRLARAEHSPRLEALLRRSAPRRRVIVDCPGGLHRCVAARCARDRWMPASLAMPVKREAA